MPIIVSKDGKGAIKINKTPFGLEDNIQEYIYNNPESIPLYDIKEDIQLLILAREFNTLSGPIDALGVDRDGELYLVETKLYKNPDKRTVVAQVLDYGASLWKSHPDFDSFMLRINNSVQETFHQTARERMQSFFSLEDSEVDTLLANIAENLEEGNFKFVVLMDTIHDQLKDLILYMNQNSKFDIYGVELEYYKHDEFEIIIPKLFGAEVKKDITSKKNISQYMTDDEFREYWINNKGTEESVRMTDELLDLINEVENGYEYKYGLSSIRLIKDGQVESFVAFIPQKSCLLFFLNMPFSEEIALKAKKTTIEIEYRKQYGNYKIRLIKDDISKNIAFLKDILAIAYKSSRS